MVQSVWRQMGQVARRFRARYLPAHIPFLSTISVCKKIGLGYVPVVAFMLAVTATVLVLLQSSEVSGSAAQPVLYLVLGGTIVAGIASIAAMLTAFSVGERVRCVLVAAEAGARGDLDQRVDSRPNGDEVDRLAESFNEMTSELRRRLEAEQRARQEAQRADQAKSQFLSTMSHELRTPLTVLIGCGALLDESTESKLSPQEQRYLQQIQQTSEYLLSIVNDSLDVARVESGHTKIEPELVVLSEILNPVFESIGPLADDRRHFFSVEAPTEPTPVVVDPVRVRQVLYNLLSNAIKFTPPGGSVTLRAIIEHRDLLLEVEDNGIGIAPDMHDRVFRQFERLHGDRIKAPGAGLGLTVTKSLVELHQGEISFESSPGVGTTFRVRLPNVVSSRTRSSNPENGQLVSALPEPEASLRMLIVDDEPLNTWLFTDVLTADGHVVLVEHDPLAAIGLVHAEHFDVLLVDILMPAMRGDDLCRRLRAEGVTVPMIAISANAMPTEINAGLSAGFDAYLAKPITPSALREAVREVVERRRAPRPGSSVSFVAS